MKRLGIVPHLYPQPLFGGLREKGSAASHPSGSRGTGETRPFGLTEDHFAPLAVQLREGKLDGAFLSPVEYAHLYGTCKIAPNVGVLSEGESGSVLLVFHEHLHTIKTIGVDPAFPSEIVLADIIMKEKYDTAPQFVPLSGSVDEALRKADAALVVDRSAIAVRDRPARLDLVDEWYDLSELPFVHGFWVVREGTFAAEEMKALTTAALPAESLPGLNPDEEEYLLNFRYTLEEEGIASLNEFFRMAYYHGVLKDIPDLRIGSTSEASKLP